MRGRQGCNPLAVAAHPHTPRMTRMSRALGAKPKDAQAVQRLHDNGPRIQHGLLDLLVRQDDRAIEEHLVLRGIALDEFHNNLNTGTCIAHPLHEVLSHQM